MSRRAAATAREAGARQAADALQRAKEQHAALEAALQQHKDVVRFRQHAACAPFKRGVGTTTPHLRSRQPPTPCANQTWLLHFPPMPLHAQLREAAQDQQQLEAENAALEATVRLPPAVHCMLRTPHASDLPAAPPCMHAPERAAHAIPPGPANALIRCAICAASSRGRSSSGAACCASCRNRATQAAAAAAVDCRRGGCAGWGCTGAWVWRYTSVDCTVPGPPNQRPQGCSPSHCWRASNCPIRCPKMARKQLESHPLLSPWQLLWAPR